MDFAANAYFNLFGNGDLFLNTVNFLAAEEQQIMVREALKAQLLTLSSNQIWVLFLVSLVFGPVGHGGGRRLGLPDPEGEKVSPRRLLPYLVVFLVLVGTYAGLRWHQAQKEAREEQAKQVFGFKADEISALTLKRGQAEIQLTRQGAAWEITKPLKARADALAAGDLVKALAQLKLERDLGPGDLKGFGLDKPGLVISFTAKGQPHQLALGNPAPGGRGFYVRKDESPQYSAHRRWSPGCPGPTAGRLAG